MKFLLLLLIVIPSLAFGGTYNCYVSTQTDVGATTTSVRVLARNNSRRCLVIQNNGASTIYIKMNSAHSGTENMSLATGATWQPIIIPVNAIYIRSSAGAVNTTVLEGN